MALCGLKSLRLISIISAIPAGGCCTWPRMTLVRRRCDADGGTAPEIITTGSALRTKVSPLETQWKGSTFFQ